MYNAIYLQFHHVVTSSTQTFWLRSGKLPAPGTFVFGSWNDRHRHLVAQYLDRIVVGPRICRRG